MITTFVDTSFLLATVGADDEHHTRAKAWQAIIAGQLLTTEYVLMEFMDALCAPQLRDLAMNTYDVVRRQPAFQVVPASSTLMDEGIAFFRKHRDKGWSLTDCISFVVMRQEDVHEALSSDHDFEQAGFKALLRSDPPRG